MHHNFTTPSPLLKSIQTALEAFTFKKVIFTAPKAQQSYAKVPFMPVVTLLQLN
jgi:hypothetical protein